MKTKLVKGKACKGRARAEETTTRFERVKMNPYLMIAIAACAEVFADSMLKASQGFKYKLPVVGIVVGYVVAFWCISQALMMLPLGPVYAIWTGAGIALTAIVGAIIWKEGFNLKKIVGLTLIIGGIVILKLGV